MNASTLTIDSNVITGRGTPTFRLLWETAGLLLVLVTASVLTWGDDAFSPIDTRLLLLSIVAMAYVGAIWANSRMLRFPVNDAAKVVFANVSVAFLVVLVVVAFGRYYYSRSFLAIAFAMSVCWQWLGLLLLQRTKLRLAVIPGSVMHELLKLRMVEWVVLARPFGSFTASGIVVDSDTVRAPEWVRFLADHALRGIPAYDALSVYEIMTGRIPLNDYRESFAEQCVAPRFYEAVKHLTDFAIVVASLPITLPLIGLIALFIRLESTGPAFFWQERVGLIGTKFCMVKFRTMYVNEKHGIPNYAVAEHHRITRLGRWLRRFRVDELPQLWNVFRGEMSLVGPRPEQLPFAQIYEKEISLYAYRHLVKPGITGWAQVNQGYAAGSDQTRTKLGYDLYYVKHLSFWFDMLIAMRTIRTVLTGYGAR